MDFNMDFPTCHYSWLFRQTLWNDIWMLGGHWTNMIFNQVSLKTRFFRNKLKSWLWQDYRLYEKFLARYDCLPLQYSSTFGAGIKSWWMARETWWGRVWRGCKSLARSWQGCARVTRRCGGRARWSGSDPRTRHVYHSLEKRWSTLRFWGIRTKISWEDKPFEKKE